MWLRAKKEQVSRWGVWLSKGEEPEQLWQQTISLAQIIGNFMTKEVDSVIIQIGSHAVGSVECIVEGNS